MANVLDRNFDFATNGTVTAAGLHNLIDETNIYAGLISTQEERTSVGTGDLLLIANSSSIGSPQMAANRTTVYNLFEDALTAGTYTNANISAALTYGTATGTRLVSANATITTGTITTGVIPTLTSSTATFGTTTSTAATITNGTITNLASTTGTIATFNSTTGTIATLNSTTGTIATLNSTTGTIATLNSTTGTIGNFSTTLVGDFTITQGTGTIGAASITPAKLSQPFASATAVASTSGTAIDFTSIPSWVKRITVMFVGVSTNGTSVPIVQIGDAGGIETSGYLARGGFTQDAGASGVTAFTTGFGITAQSNAGSIYHGHVVLTSLGSGNTWVASGVLGRSESTVMTSLGGSKSLSDTLDRVRITTVNGTDTFDAGSVNIMYEG